MIATIITGMIACLIGILVIMYGLRDVLAVCLRIKNRFFVGKNRTPSWRKGALLICAGIALFAVSFLVMMNVLTPGPGMISTWQQTTQYLQDIHGEAVQLEGLSISAKASDSPEPYYEITYRTARSDGVLNAYYTQDSDKFTRFEEP